MNDGSMFTMLKNVEKEAERMGFSLGVARYGGGSNLSLRPIDDNLPCYARDTEFMSGSLENLYGFLAGWERALQYFSVMGIANKKRIEKFESNFREKKLIDKLKGVEIDK